VRFVATFAIAIATLLSSATPGWGQPPSLKGPSPLSRLSARTPKGFPTQPASNVSLTPPESVEGTWVSDDSSPMLGDPAGGMAGALACEGEYGGACGIDGAGCDGAGDGSCGPPGGPGAGAGAGPSFLGHHLVYTDLWTEVHSHRRIYVQADYMLMWAKGNQLPPLVTTSPLGTPQAEAGVLPAGPNTQILFGGERVDQDRREGGRINVGYWLIDGEFLGIEGQYFTLVPEHTHFNKTSTFSDGIGPGDIILARPFLNVDPNLVTPTQDAAIVAFPNFVLNQSEGPLDGTINIKTTSNVQSANALFRKLMWIDFTRQRRLDLLLGYRFFRVDDSVIINDSSDFLPTTGPIGPVSFASEDTFSARNRFNGGEIGLKGQSYHGPISLEFVTKVAFGNNRENVFINGTNSITVGGITTTGVGGLLAQPTNIGSYQRDVFAIVPEGDFNIRWNITRNLRGTFGYTFVYINRVQRSGEAIDTTLNPTQIGGTLVGEPRPAFGFIDTPFWVQGVTSGFEYRW
jgi:hypothetical protein